MAGGKNKLVILSVVAVLAAGGIGVGSYLGQTKKGLGIQGAAGLQDLKSESFDPAKSGKKVYSIKTDTKVNCSSTPWVIAEKKGFFAEEGINIEYTGELTTAQVLPSILNGTNNVSSAHVNNVATYIAGGANIKGVTIGGSEPTPEVDDKYHHMKYYVSPKLGVSSLAELIGKKNGEKITINGTVPSCATFIATNAFDHLGFDRNQIKFVSFESDTAALQANQQGNIDIVGVHPPFYKLAKDSGLIELFDTADTGLGEAAGTTFYYFTEQFIKDNPEAVQGFVNAIKKAQAWIVDPKNEEEAIKLTGDYIGQPVNAVHYYYTGKGFQDKLIQPWIDDLVVSGALKKNQLHVSDLITTEFDKS
ncbi:ABC transporter substrate-binding protein [Paenibacillus sp. S150]|uniref:ABC transporter substrate-binding protein n=1 Tax=Paenibacillus sp. S150 TaxID=2749826 RepID=UPI001C55D1FA|nr:ABC transporter substrate-binding protein [Paenibacillus sp. S150]MBW4082978.1 ABC transporter substrate-binding protein [Paenibacillus sp. S150]